MSHDKIDCPHCGKSRRLDLCDLGTGPSDIDCEKCEKTIYLYIEYSPDITVSKKPFNEEEVTP